MQKINIFEKNNIGSEYKHIESFSFFFNMKLYKV